MERTSLPGRTRFPPTLTPARPLALARTVERCGAYSPAYLISRRLAGPPARRLFRFLNARPSRRAFPALPPSPPGLMCRSVVTQLTSQGPGASVLAGDLRPAGAEDRADIDQGDVLRRDPAVPAAVLAPLSNVERAHKMSNAEGIAFIPSKQSRLMPNSNRPHFQPQTPARSTLNSSLETPNQSAKEQCSRRGTMLEMIKSSVPSTALPHSGPSR